jgi:hypothetical protein
VVQQHHNCIGRNDPKNAKKIKMGSDETIEDSLTELELPEYISGQTSLQCNIF